MMSGGGAPTPVPPSTTSGGGGPGPSPSYTNPLASMIGGAAAAGSTSGSATPGGSASASIGGGGGGGLTQLGGSADGSPNDILTKVKLRELVKQLAPNERLEPDVEEVLLEVVNDFLESAVHAGATFARHRQSDTLEVKDIALYLERNWDMKIAGYSQTDERVFRRPAMSEAHKKRLLQIKRTNEASLTRRKGRKRKTPVPTNE